MSADLSFLLDQGREIWLVPPQIDAPRHVHVKDVGFRGDALTIEFEEVQDIGLGERLIGCHCLIGADEDFKGAISQTMSSQHAGMVSWSFFDKNTGIGGIVTDVYDSAGQLMLVVEHDGKESLVPYSKDFVESIDEESRSIVFICPSGLFDL